MYGIWKGLTLFEAAKKRAVMGSSKDPGTYVVNVLAAVTPQADKDSLIPFGMSIQNKRHKRAYQISSM